MKQLLNKKKSAKKNICVLFCLLCFLAGCSSVKNAADVKKPSGSVLLSDGVNHSMLNPEYWLKKCKNPDEVLMGTKEIHNWNLENFCKESNRLLLADLRKFDSVMTGEEIRKSMLRYNQKITWYKKIKVKGREEIHELRLKDWKSIYEEMNYALLGSFAEFSGQSAFQENKEDYPVKKAVTVCRSNLRLIPDDDFYTDDKDFWYDDAAQNSGILMNEPVLVLWESKNGLYWFVKTAFCSGWILKENVALCSDEEFNMYFDWTEKNPEGFVTVTQDRFALPEESWISDGSATDGAYKTEFFMGTNLFTSDWNNEAVLAHFAPRVPHSSFLVQVPFRKNDGTLGKRLAVIPCSNAVQGLLPFTRRNVVNLAFKPLGNRYGWGGMENSRDCSEYLKDIHRCFGFIFPRNSRSQLLMSGKTFNLENKSLSAKKSVLDSLHSGTVMGFPGHVFMYLGKENGSHYVISALGAVYPETENEEKTEILSVNVNTMNVRRKTGKTWLEIVTQAKLLYGGENKYQNVYELNPKWKFAEFSKINDGSVFLYRAEKNRKNIVVAVNAGHGTKGGSRVKTFSHPDRTPKITGGTTPSGSVESIAISEGMIFKDGKTEAQVNLRTARFLCKMLLEKGYDVLMTRDYDDLQLDNIGRTVMANNLADIHIAIHYDGDNRKTDKGVFYCSIPEGLKKLKTVKKHWKKSERLGQCLVEGLKNQGLEVYGEGRGDTDLTQTSYSTIPTVDIELGNQNTDTSSKNLIKRAEGLLEGIEKYFKE